VSSNRPPFPFLSSGRDIFAEAAAPPRYPWGTSCSGGSSGIPSPVLHFVSSPRSVLFVVSLAFWYSTNDDCLFSRLGGSFLLFFRGGCADSPLYNFFGYAVVLEHVLDFAVEVLE